MISNKTGKTIILSSISAFIVLLFTLTCYAGTAGTSSEPATSAKPLMEGGGGSGGGTVLPDLFTGTMSYSIPIEVPPGRRGMQPNLALTYRSNSGNGYVGVGWDLEIGAIERSARDGINYDGDEYILRMVGSAVDLVYDNNEGFYRAKIEGAFYRIKKVPASGNPFYFEVTDKCPEKFKKRL